MSKHIAVGAVALSMAISALLWSASRTAVAVLVVANLVAAAVIYYRQKTYRSRKLDRLFWVVTLRPLWRLNRAQRDRLLGELSKRPLHHPVHGPTWYTEETLRGKLARVSRRPVESQLSETLLGYRELLREATR